MNVYQENERVLLLAQHLEELKSFYRVNYEFKSFGKLKIDNDEKKAWCEKNCKDEYYGYFSMWYFKSKQDYLMFMLRWPK